MHKEGIQPSIISWQKTRRKVMYYILSIVWRNPQPIVHDHFVLDSLTCIHAGQLQNYC